MNGHSLTEAISFQQCPPRAQLHLACPRGATLEADGQSWLLRYQVQCFDYGERLPRLVDVTVPLVAMSHEDALNLAGVILRGHKSPEAPEQSQAQLPEEEPPDSIFISGGMKHLRNLRPC